MPALSQELDQIELMPLADRRVLMILVTRDRMVRNRVVTLDEPISAEELVSIRNYVNRNFSGWQLGEARRELVRRMVEDRELYQEAMRKLQVLYQKGLLDMTTSGRKSTWKARRNLLGLDLHLTREKMRDLFRALEEKKRLIELLDRFLEQPPGRAGGPCRAGRSASGDEGPGADRHDRADGQRTCPRKSRCSAPCGCITSASWPRSCRPAVRWKTLNFKIAARRRPVW